MSQDHDPSAQSDTSKKKVAAVYALREAAEAKAVAELHAERDATPAARDALLNAQLELEAKTQDAVEACHECGHVHGTDEPHYTDNVVAFKKSQQNGDRSG